MQESQGESVTRSREATTDFWKALSSWSTHRRLPHISNLNLVQLRGFTCEFRLSSTVWKRLGLEAGNPLISKRDVVEMVASYLQEERRATDIKTSIKARHRSGKKGNGEQVSTRSGPEGDYDHVGSGGTLLRPLMGNDARPEGGFRGKWLWLCTVPVI